MSFFVIRSKLNDFSSPDAFRQRRLSPFSMPIMSPGSVAMLEQLGVDLWQKVAPTVSVDRVGLCLLDSYGFSDTLLLIVRLFDR